MRLYTLLRDVQISKTNIADFSSEICSVSEHSDRVEPGCVFVCISGVVHDGHDYIDRALLMGAAVIVAQRMTEELSSSGAAYVITPDTRAALALMYSALYGYPQNAMRMIALTGTNGKSSTAYILRSILECAGQGTGLIGSIKNEYGSLALPNNSMTTPDPAQLYEILSAMRSAGAKNVIIEASSHALALSRLHGITFDVGVFTNLSPEHLDFHPTMEHYASAKARLFSVSKLGVVNADDGWTHVICEGAACPIRTYSLKGKADYTASSVEFHAGGGIEYCLLTKRELIRLKSALSGTFAVYNTLAAASAAYELGVASADIVSGIKAVNVIPGRLEKVENTGEIDVYIDYAHTPAALEGALSEVRRHSRGRVIVVMGCGGMRDKVKRPFMGRIAAEMSELCIITTDNPRQEDPDSIIAQIVSGIDGGKVAIIRDREEAIAYAISEAKAGDTVVLAGKGHEQYQIMADGEHPFSEKEIISKYTK